MSDKASSRVQPQKKGEGPAPRNTKTATRKREKRVTIADVAAKVGVAKGTVSRVLSGTYPASEQLTQRVQQAVTELGYTPSVSATALATGRSNAIAILMTEPFDELFSDPTYSTILKGAWEQMAHTALVPVLLQVSTADEQEKALRLLGNHLADAVIHLSPWRDDGLLAALRDSNIPVVLCGLPQSSVDTSGFSVVYSDDVHGGLLAAEYMRDAGCSNPVAILGPASDPAARDRLEGYRQVFISSLPKARVSFQRWTEPSGAAAMQRFIEAGLAFDGVLCASDRLARGALSILQREGISVPGTVKVIGYDDHPAVSTLDPGLTTVAQPMLQQGREALHLAIEMLKGHPSKTRILPVKVTQRITA